MKGRQIAKQLGFEKKVVNSYLSKQNGVFVQDANHGWRIAAIDLFEVRFEESRWVDGLSYDKSIFESGSPLESECRAVKFTVPQGCKLLLEASAPPEKGQAL